MGLFYFLFFIVETGESVLVIKGPQGRINRAVWGPLNSTIISAGEDTVVRVWDSEVNITVLFWFEWLNWRFL